MLQFGENLGVLVKNVNVGKFNDFDKICILRATIIMRNDFGILEKFEGLRID